MGVLRTALQPLTNEVTIRNSQACRQLSAQNSTGSTVDLRRWMPASRRVEPSPRHEAAAATYADHAAAAAAATALCGELSKSKSFRMTQVASLVVKDRQIQDKMLAAISKSQAAAPVGTESLEFDLHEKMQLRATAQLPRGIRRVLQRRRMWLYHLFILVMGVLVGLIAFTLSKVNPFSAPCGRPFAS